MKCPVCETQTKDHLMCRRCFFEAPTNDRVKLGNLYLRNQQKPQVYISKYAQVVNDARKRRGLAPVNVVLTKLGIACIPQDMKIEGDKVLAMDVGTKDTTGSVSGSIKDGIVTTSDIQHHAP